MSIENVQEPDYSRLRFLDYVGVRVPNGPPVRMMLFEGNYLVTDEEGTIENMLANRLKARKISEDKYEEIFAQYKQQKLLERKGSSAPTAKEPVSDETQVYAAQTKAPVMKPKFKSFVEADGTYAAQRPDRPTVIAQRGLSEENDVAIGDVIENVSRGGRRSIPKISPEELQGKVPAQPKPPVVDASQRPEPQPAAEIEPQEAVSKPEPEEASNGSGKTLGGPKFSAAPQKMPPTHMPEQKMVGSVIGVGFPGVSDVQQPAAKPTPPKHPAPPLRPAPPTRPPIANKPPEAPEQPKAEAPKTRVKPPKPQKKADTPKQAKPTSRASAPSADLLYDDEVATTPAATRKKDKSYVIVTTLVSIAIVALLIVATLLLVNTSGVMSTVDEYNVVVLVGEVTAGQTITEEHIGNVVISKGEYEALTANSFEVTAGGEAVMEIPVPYERREEVVGLIAKDDYATGTIITNRLVSDQRTITNKYFNIVGEDGLQQLEVTIDSETGMATVKVYAIAPNESGVGVAILVGEATLTDSEFMALLNGDTSALLSKLVLVQPQGGDSAPEDSDIQGDASSLEGATDEDSVASADDSAASSTGGGEGDE